MRSVSAANVASGSNNVVAPPWPNLVLENACDIPYLKCYAAGFPFQVIDMSLPLHALEMQFAFDPEMKAVIHEILDYQDNNFFHGDYDLNDESVIFQSDGKVLCTCNRAFGEALLDHVYIFDHDNDNAGMHYVEYVIVDNKWDSELAKSLIWRLNARIQELLNLEIVGFVTALNATGFIDFIKTQDQVQTRCNLGL